jgi:methionyl-tRNA synthetase
MHVGHLSGPYIAGDIAARAARAAGRDVLTLCGLDSHQNYVLAKATAEGLTGAEAVAKFGDLIRDSMTAARIDYELFLEPLSDRDYQAGVARLLTELVDSKAITVEETTLRACGGCSRVLHHVRVSGACPVCGEGAGGGTCEGCGSFLTAADLVGATSTCCSAEPVPIQATVPVLHMEQYRTQLTEVWARAAVPPRVRALLIRYLVNGLPDVPLAYPTDWGIRWPHQGTDYRVDVWAEMAFGYLYAVPRHLTGTSPASAAECVQAWSGIDEMWHFFGVDNAFYYAALVPALLAACGLPTGKLAGLLVNEFYRLDGLKFSTSRNHAIWAHEFLSAEDPAVIRAFLSWDRPDRSSTDFTMANYEAFREQFSAVRAGTAATPMATTLAGSELDRAERALGLDGFDPALAVRAVLNAYHSAPERAYCVLRAITGE